MVYLLQVRGNHPSHDRGLATPVSVSRCGLAVGQDQSVLVDQFDPHRLEHCAPQFLLQVWVAHNRLRNRIVKVGDIVGGYRIKEIDATTVILEKDQETFNLKLKKEE